MLNNILYLSNKFYKYKFTNSPLYSFCIHENETTLHIFYSYYCACRLLSQLDLFLEQNLIPLYLLLQTTIFGFLGKPNNQNFMLLNHLLLLFKLNAYDSRNDAVLCFSKLLRDITKVKKMEKKTSFSISNENNPV